MTRSGADPFVLAVALALLALGCGNKPADVVGAERERFAARCKSECTGNGFQEGRVKETEVVSETITRECWCYSAGKTTTSPRFVEKGPR